MPSKNQWCLTGLDQFSFSFPRNPGSFNLHWLIVEHKFGKQISPLANFVATEASSTQRLKIGPLPWFVQFKFVWAWLKGIFNRLSGFLVYLIQSKLNLLLFWQQAVRLIHLSKQYSCLFWLTHGISTHWETRSPSLPCQEIGTLDCSWPSLIRC